MPRGQLLLFAVQRYGFGIVLLLVLLLCAFFLLSDYAGEQDAYEGEQLTRTAVERSRVPPSGSAAVRLEEGGNLSVTTYPLDATVLVDFDSVGVTPLEGHRLSSGVYVLSVRKAGYSSLDTVIVVGGVEQPEFAFLLDQIAEEDLAAAESAGPVPSPRAAQPERASPQTRATPPPSLPEVQGGGQAEAQGRLHITSEPSGAVVWIGLRAVGNTPLTLPEVPVGTHRVTILHENGRERYVADVRVDPGATAEVHGQLRPRTGTLTVLVRPWGSIYIDGQLHKQDADVQYEAQLPPGRHRVRAVHPVLGVQEREVQISAGASQRLVIDLR